MMFSKAEGEAYELECTVPTSAGCSQTFSVQLSGCENPLCDCQLIQMEMGTTDSNPTAEKLVLAINLSDRAVVPEQEGNDALYKSFVSQMNASDWSFLKEQYVRAKMSLTLTADLDKLEPDFPIYDVEENSTLIGYEEILPFHPFISFDIDGNRYFVMDLYCVNRRCNCSKVHLSIASDDQTWNIDKDELRLAFDLKTGKHTVEEQTGRAEALNPLDVMQEVLKVIDIKELGQRYRQMRKWYRSYFDRVQIQGRLVDSLPANTPVFSSSVNVSVGGVSSVGRNDPCPCGSGKKYKKCCLNVSV